PSWAKEVEVAFSRDGASSPRAAIDRERAALGASGSPISTKVGSEGRLRTGESTVTAASATDGLRETEDEPLPARFGRYAVTRLLGRGGYGSVYLARDEELGRLVAIKVPRAQSLNSPEMVETILAEARVAAELGHPSIVKVHDVGRNPEHGVFVVFEYIEGR